MNIKARKSVLCSNFCVQRQDFGNQFQGFGMVIDGERLRTAKKRWEISSQKSLEAYVKKSALNENHWQQHSTIDWLTIDSNYPLPLPMPDLKVAALDPIAKKMYCLTLFSSNVSNKLYCILLIRAEELEDLGHADLIFPTLTKLDFIFSCSKPQMCIVSFFHFYCFSIHVLLHLFMTSFYDLGVFATAAVLVSFQFCVDLWLSPLLEKQKCIKNALDS
uniref:Uncharacterized protein n=1 Tax=Glossina brevipalpis TaxID=37001 RepID=A0A1A9WS89_9MUSC